MSTRRQTIKALGAGSIAAALGIPLTTRAQTPPIETVRIIVGFPPGGTTDAFARGLADKLRGNYATTAVVDDKAGAGGQVGVMTVRDGPADGSAMLLTPGSMLTIYPYTYPKLQYKSADVAPISTALYTAHAFGVGPLVPLSVKTLRDFLDWAKANPGLANYGTPGAGSMPHLVAALLEKASGVAMKQIPYRGSGLASRTCWAARWLDFRRRWATTCPTRRPGACAFLPSPERHAHGLRRRCRPTLNRGSRN